MKADTHKSVGVYFFDGKIERRRKRKRARKESDIGNGAKRKSCNTSVCTRKNISRFWKSSGNME